MRYLLAFLLFLLAGTNAYATDKFWVGGTGNWSDDTNHWALSSGGSPGGGNLPTSSDNVFFDSMSNATAYTVTFDTPAKNCLDFNMDKPGTSGNVTWAGSFSITIAGSMTIQHAANITRTWSGDATFSAATGMRTITTGGLVFANNFTFSGNGGTWTLQDDIDFGAKTLSVTGGTFDAATHNVSGDKFSTTSTTAHTVKLGTGTWTLRTNGTIWTASGSGTSITKDSSLIKFTNNGTGSKTFAGGGFTYNNFENATANTGAVIVSGSNTFSDFKIDSGRTQQFNAGTTTTLTTLTATGGSVIQSVTAATHTLSASAGTISVAGFTIDHSIATGGATWKAPTSSSNVDGGNNTGWDFTPVAGGTSNSLMLRGVGELTEPANDDDRKMAANQ